MPAFEYCCKCGSMIVISTTCSNCGHQHPNVEHERERHGRINSGLTRTGHMYAYCRTTQKGAATRPNDLTLCYWGQTNGVFYFWIF
ncbi:hypothetical protein A9K55_004278 [Cordyceps militaris]|uniref:Uncharacterized protein n=1 Tax=Cordyceps militaris TaxID=73501 RepID=A0A2H4SQ64_CORMI|nr:hypothetical protein A9K55_004278 [Cordyceps militaris]